MKNIKVLGIPFNFGQPHTGVEHALTALRYHGFFDELAKISHVKELGCLDFSLIALSGRSDSALIKNARTVDLASELISHCIAGEKLANSFLLNIGGDHGMGLGTVHGMLQHSPETIIVWADAHGDINTPESSPSGNFHGMPLSYLLGISDDHRQFLWLKKYLSPKKLIFFGPRDLDPAEKEIISELSIQYYSSSYINEFGADSIVSRALKLADPTEKAPIHLSFDVDIFDAQDVFATGTRVAQGPKVSEVMRMGEILGSTGRLRSMDLVEINPDLAEFHEVQHTLKLAQEFTLKTLRALFQANRTGEHSVWRNIAPSTVLSA